MCVAKKIRSRNFAAGLSAGILLWALAINTTQAADLAVTNSGNWTNTAIWNGGVLPTIADSAYMCWSSWRKGYTVTVDKADAVCLRVYVGQDSGLPAALRFEPGASFTGAVYVALYAGTTGRVFQTGGVITGSMQLGGTSEGRGSYTLSGGTNYCPYMSLNNYGVVTQSSGKVQGLRLTLGTTGTTGAVYEISGGTLNMTDTGANALRIGTTGGRDGVFRVVGTNATITATYIGVNSNNAMHLVLKEGGVSKTTLSGNVVFTNNAELRLDVDFSKYRWRGSNITFISYGGTRSGTFGVTNIINRFVTCDGIEYDDVNKTITLMNVNLLSGTIFKGY